MSIWRSPRPVGAVSNRTGYFAKTVRCSICETRFL
ncbi:hypothetical protein F4054_05315 [Candidatus Poribacteria bacterium]|nr:hypothetical protein [Candidatus Poribacteria bacterium]MYG06381.1 hypothetical protein [Candidatus Poribacteria bacterium]MYK21665.1 hypothetical protein [Candidatus Poribacteria bacterium]